MTIAARGEVELTVADKTYTLLLTAGALARIEKALGLLGAVDLTERLAKGGMHDICVVLTELVRGGGTRDVTLDQVLDWPLAFADANAAVSAAFAAQQRARADGDAPPADASAGNA